MPESITLSFSQPSNHITTHFNNFQEERINLNPNNPNNFRHILPKSSYNSKVISNLYPRSIIYDYINGTGALNPSVFFENVHDLDAYSSLEKIQLLPRVHMNNFQQNFINGVEHKENLNRTDYWSDYSRVTYRPSSIHLHPNYLYDINSGKGIDKNNENSQFEGFQNGLNSFEQIESFKYSTEEEIRKLFEESNSVNQINVVLELDSSWSGVCSSILKNVVDDQLNGRGQKIVIWSYQNDSTNMENWNFTKKIDRIRTVLDLGCDIDISGFVMLNSDFQFDEMKTDNIWNRSCYFANLIDMFSNIDNSHDITTIMQKLTDGGLRKFINDVKLLWNLDKAVDLSCKNIFPTTREGNQYTFAKTVMCRSNTDSSSAEIVKFADFDNLNQNGTPKFFLDIQKDQNDPVFNDYMPPEFENSHVLASSLATTNKLKYGFNDMFETVSKFCKTDEREDFKDKLDTLKESYTFGFEHSDNEDEFD